MVKQGVSPAQARRVPHTSSTRPATPAAVQRIVHDVEIDRADVIRTQSPVRAPGNSNAPPTRIMTTLKAMETML
jgi:hypothetical protein